jgi:hypothetical protein
MVVDMYKGTKNEYFDFNFYLKYIKINFLN